MSVNSVNATTAYTPKYQNTYNNTAKVEEDKKSKDEGVVYQKGSSSTKATYAKEDVVARLKKDAEDRTSQLRSLVQQMMGNQGNRIGQADDMWRFLAKGNFTVTPDVKAQAQKDIADDGYWGVRCVLLSRKALRQLPNLGDRNFQIFPRELTMLLCLSSMTGQA